MNALAWFFFKLLMFEYIEDPKTGMAFRLPGGHCWKIFVEVLTIYHSFDHINLCTQVPSFTEVAQGNAKQHLKWIQDEIPIFKILGLPFLVEKTR